MRNKGFRSSREGVSNDRHHEERAVPPCVPGPGRNRGRRRRRGPSRLLARGERRRCEGRRRRGRKRGGRRRDAVRVGSGSRSHHRRHVDGGHRHPRHRRRFGRLRVRRGGGREGRQGDRRREDVQLERPRRRLRRHQLALHGRAGHRGGQGERQAALDRPVREPRERGPHREVLQQLRRGVQLAAGQGRGRGRLRDGGRVLQPRRRVRRAAGLPHAHDPRGGRPHLDGLRRRRAVLQRRREGRRGIRVRFAGRAAGEGRHEGDRLHLRGQGRLRAVQCQQGRGAVHGRHRRRPRDVQGVRPHLRRVRPAAQPVHARGREHGRRPQDGHVGWRAACRCPR